MVGHCCWNFSGKNCFGQIIVVETNTSCSKWQICVLSPQGVHTFDVASGCLSSHPSIPPLVSICWLQPYLRNNVDWVLNCTDWSSPCSPWLLGCLLCTRTCKKMSFKMATKLDLPWCPVFCHQIVRSHTFCKHVLPESPCCLGSLNSALPSSHGKIWWNQQI